jgi:hypothetical protein
MDLRRCEASLWQTRGFFARARTVVIIPDESIHDAGPQWPDCDAMLLRPVFVRYVARAVPVDAWTLHPSLTCPPRVAGWLAVPPEVTNFV